MQEKIPMNLTSKQLAELAFWVNELRCYVDWMEGKMPRLYNTPAPGDEEKMESNDIQQSSILTWLKLHQMPKYLEDLKVSSDCFDGMKVLDVGSGPMPSALVFENCHLFALDPLHPYYKLLGFPYEEYVQSRIGGCMQNVDFVPFPAEKMPFPDDSFDAVIAVNAIDHVDSFDDVAREILRVLKSDGKLALHIHCHSSTICEPIELNEERVMSAFATVKNFHVVNRSQGSFSSATLPENECFILFRNF